MIVAHSLGVGTIYVGTSLSYILAPMLGWWFFDEKVKPSQWKYFGLIVLGIIVYAWKIIVVNAKTVCCAHIM